jgi:PAS domain S-box-containing protein
VLHVRIKIYCFLVTAVSFLSLIRAREPEFKSDQIIPRHGLSQSSVNCILQDRNGLMWFGTWDGLNKYNGYDFTVFRPVTGDSTSISNNVIRTIFEDSNGDLWIGTERGLNKYNQEADNFTRYCSSNTDTATLSDNIVLAIIEDNKNQLWVGTKGGGLCSYNKESNNFKRFYNTCSPESNNIHVIIEDNLNRDFLWIGTDEGLFKFNTESELFVPCLKDRFKKMKQIRNIRALSQDKEGDLFIGTWGDGLYKYFRNIGVYRQYPYPPGNNMLKYNYVATLLNDLSDILWIGTRDGGLIRLNMTTGEFMIPGKFSSLDPLSNRVIMSLYKSPSGILWAGTKYYGIFKLVPSYKNFSLYKKENKNISDINSNVITAILVDSDGILWLGTRNRGLYKYDREADRLRLYSYNPFANSISSNNVLTLAESSKAENKYLWIGTDGGGISKFFPSTGVFVNYRHNDNKNNSLCNDQVYSLLEYDADHLFIGTYGSKFTGGMDLFNIKSNRYINFRNNPASENSLSSNIIFNIYMDRSGTIWIGTKGGGLNKLTIENIDGQTPEEIGHFKRYLADPDNPSGLSNNDILAIYEDSRGSLWIGTAGGGLNMFNREQEIFTHYTEKNGLANNIVYGILEDDRNNLWISTANGLSKFNTWTGEFRNYDRRDGLRDNVFNLGACFKSVSGELFFGSVNGCNSFYPDSIKENLHIPDVILTRILLYKKDTVIDARTYTGKSLMTLKEIILPHYINDISFEFAALEYSAPQKNRYKYKLEGYNSDWIDTDAQRRFANYTNLKNGRYTFRVIASNEDGNWNEEGTFISVIIERPFWKKTWFIITLFILAAAIIALVFIILLRRYRLEKSELEKKAQESIFDERNQLNTLIDNMPDLIYIKDRQSRFIMGNKKVAAVMGTIPKNLIGKTDFDFYTYDLASRFYNDEQVLMKTGKPKINYEEPGLDEHGNRIVLSTTKVPLKNKRGEVVGLVGIGRDITRLKNIEKELRKKTDDLQDTNQLLEERQEEIQQQAEELNSQTDNLRRVNIELERLNKTKDKFFSIIAHDLKNPFHAIIGFSELLRKDFHSMDDKQKIGLLELINVSSQSAYSLLENLLQWARSQTDKIKFTPENIDISEIVKSAVDLHSISAEKKKIKIKSHIRDKHLVYADKNMITTVIRNLISNAIKFTRSNGKIEVSCNDNEKDIEITISDNGIGIDKDNLDNLFRIDAYYSTTGTLGESGTGLGLIICKEFIEKNGGNIKVVSEEGKGSAFSFTLPAGKVSY